MAMEQLSRHDRQGETAAVAGAPMPCWRISPPTGRRRSGATAASSPRGSDAESIWSNLNRQVFLGDDDFVARMQALSRDGPSGPAIPRAQQRPPAPPLDEIAARYPTRDTAIAAAHATGAYSYQQIAEAFGVASPPSAASSARLGRAACYDYRPDNHLGGLPDLENTS